MKVVAGSMNSRLLLRNFGSINLITAKHVRCNRFIKHNMSYGLKIKYEYYGIAYNLTTTANLFAFHLHRWYYII